MTPESAFWHASTNTPIPEEPRATMSAFVEALDAEYQRLGPLFLTRASVLSHISIARPVDEFTADELREIAYYLQTGRHVQ